MSAEKVSVAGESFVKPFLTNVISLQELDEKTIVLGKPKDDGHGFHLYQENERYKNFRVPMEIVLSHSSCMTETALNNIKSTLSVIIKKKL